MALGITQMSVESARALAVQALQSSSVINSIINAGDAKPDGIGKAIGEMHNAILKEIASGKTS